MKKTKYKINILKIVRFIIILLALIALIIFACNWFNNDTNITPNETETTATPTPDITISMAVTGDIMCHNTMYMDAYNSSTSSYDFSHFFTDIKSHLENADITIGNLETTFAGSNRGYSGYPTFNTPEALAQNLKDAGFDVLSTANNHSLDKGFSGLTSTINYLDEAGLSHTGTYASEEKSKEILIKNVNGISIAFLSFTYGTNGIPVPNGKDFCINLIDEEKILNQLNLAKAQSPDIICVCMHWGVEYQTKPNPTQQELTELLFKNGADIILGNHPHVLQPMEKRIIELDDGTTKEGFVIYSLGNFMANQNFKYTQDSAILNLNITKNGQTNKISIDTATYTPIYIYKDKSKSKQKFRLLDIETTIKNYDAGIDTSIGKTTYNTLVNELANIKRIIGEEIK